MKICFTIPGDPMGKQRPRVTQYGTYTPQKTQAYEELARLRYREAARLHGIGVLEGAVSVYITAFFSVPASYRKLRKEMCRNGSERPTKKPDADNIAKIVLDALNGGIAYKDDAQVVRLEVSKVYAPEVNGAGRVYVEIEEVT